MIAFSIDLGVDLAATGGRRGTEDNPFPLQVELCRGRLEKGKWLVNQKPWSFRDLRSRDQLIFRIFDLSEPGPGDGVGPPQMLRAVFRAGSGSLVPSPWKPSAEKFTYQAVRSKENVTFATTTRQSFPCYRQLDDKRQPVLYTLHDVEQPETFLLSAMIALAPGAGENSERFFGSDPEMVIGPYDGTGGGGKSRRRRQAAARRQLPARLAASRW